jgi:antitoxin PrlF
MQTVISKLTKKYQATIPELIRKNLSLEAGDTVAFDLEGGRIFLRKAQAIDLAFIQSLEGTLTEWNSAFDEEAYGDL